METLLNFMASALASMGFPRSTEARNTRREVRSDLGNYQAILDAQFRGNANLTAIGPWLFWAEGCRASKGHECPFSDH